MRRATARGHPQRPRGLAAHDDPLASIGAALAGLEAQARVISGESTDVTEIGGAPFLVGHEQQGELGEQLRARRQRARDAEREHDAALHIGRAGAV